MDNEQPSTSPMLLNSSSSSGTVYRYLQSFLAYGQYFLSLFLSYFSCFQFIRLNQRYLRLVRILGEGSYGYVWLAKEYEGTSTRTYALKQLVCREPEQEQLIKKEINAYQKIQSSYDTTTSLYSLPTRTTYILPLIDAAYSRRRDGLQVANLLFPLMEGNVQDIINQQLDRYHTPHYPSPPHQQQKKGPTFHTSASTASAVSATNVRTGILEPFTETACLQIACSLIQGLQILHSHGYVHRDLCPRNILVQNRRNAMQGVPNTVMIADLGSVATYPLKLTNRNEVSQLLEEASLHSSPPYRAPELWSVDPGNVITETTDIWSLGCTLYAMAFGYSPYESVRTEEGRLRLCEPTHVRILAPLQFPLHHNYSSPFIQLVSRMLETVPSKRINLKESLGIVQGMLGGNGGNGGGTDKNNGNGTTNAAVTIIVK